MIIGNRYSVLTSAATIGLLLLSACGAEKPVSSDEASADAPAAQTEDNSDEGGTPAEGAAASAPRAKIEASLVHMRDIMPEAFDACEVTFRLKNGSDALLGMVSLNFLAVGEDGKPVAKGMVAASNLRGGGNSVETTALSGTPCKDIAKFTDLRINPIADQDVIDTEPLIGGDNIVPLVVS